MNGENWKQAVMISSLEKKPANGGIPAIAKQPISIKAHLRRTETIETAAEESSNSGKQEISIGELIIVPDAFVAKKRGNEVELTHREFELLFHLATHMGQVMTREHLLETVWGYDYFGDVRTVDVTIRRLREKIEDTPSRPEYILTRRGVGYYMKNYD